MEKQLERIKEQLKLVPFNMELDCLRGELNKMGAIITQEVYISPNRTISFTYNKKNYVLNIGRSKEKTWTRTYKLTKKK